MTRAGRRAAQGGGENQERNDAFTLIEIMVAMAVLSLILVILASIGGQVNKAMLLGLAGNERRGNDRALLDFLATELQLAVVPPPPQPVQTAVPMIMSPNPTGSFQFLINPPGISSTNAQTIFWQAPAATVQTSGNMAEIGYGVVWTNIGGANEAYLRKFFVNQGDANFLIYSQPTNWIDDALFQTVAPADAAHDYQGLFAENVFALWARALDSTGNPIVTTAAGTAFPPYAYDSRQGYTDSSGTIHPSSSLPAMVEVAIVVADSRTAQRLTKLYPPTATVPANFWSDINQYVSSFPSVLASGIHVYSTRILLRSAY